MRDCCCVRVEVYEGGHVVAVLGVFVAGGVCWVRGLGCGCGVWGTGDGENSGVLLRRLSLGVGVSMRTGDGRGIKIVKLTALNAASSLSVLSELNEFSLAGETAFWESASSTSEIGLLRPIMATGFPRVAVPLGVPNVLTGKSTRARRGVVAKAIEE